MNARAFLDLSACRIFTVRQQIAAVLFVAALGAVGALMAEASYDAKNPAPVKLLDPVIERFDPESYSVYRIVFEHRGIESWCHIVIYSATGTWNVKCH